MGLILANPPQQVSLSSSRPSPWEAPALLRLWHLASLDAPTVAVTWAWAFAHAVGIRLPVWILSLLGLVVWAIYIGDRLMDIRSELRDGPRHALQERHYFHWRHRRILLPLAGSAGAAAVWLVASHLSGAAIGRDSFVAVAAVAYFSGVHADAVRPSLASRIARRLVSREFLVGIIFSAGCILPLVSLGLLRHLAPPVLLALLSAALFFAALAWLNVRAINHWESFTSHQATRRAAWLLVACGTLLAMACAAVSPHASALLFAGAASALFIGLLDRYRARFSPLALRIAADAVLLTPLLLAFLPLGTR